jgi:hypothetical protein
LNTRQKNELDFYLKDFNKELKADKNFARRYDLFYFKDTLFTFSVNPILGLSYYTNDTGSFYRRWNGGEMFAYAGNHFGFYASLRDHHESKVLSDPAFLNQAEAATYKYDVKGGGDYDELRGGMSWSWSWGSIAVVKDHLAWGDNYHGSNIFSAHQPSFTSLKFHMNPVKWFDFNYYHGWLVSDVIDSSRSYYNGNSVRLVMQPKYVAANLFTFIPWEHFSASVGNSIIYSDQAVNPAYLVPFFFYKTADHSITSAGSNFLGQNSQMFFNLSSRNIKNVHIYFSGFIDEIALGRALDEDQHTNFYSLKIGSRVNNLLNKNIAVTAEYTRNNPGAYRHYLLTGTFASAGYNLGHYLGENSQEIYLSVSVRPVAKLFAELSYTIAQKGKEYIYTGSTNDPLGNGKGHPFIDKVYWENSEIQFRTHYELVNDLRIFAGITSGVQEGTTLSLEKYSMPYYSGAKTTLNFGVNAGF